MTRLSRTVAPEHTSKHTSKHTPKHRARRTDRLRSAVRRQSTLAGVAVAATAATVTVGVTATAGTGELSDPAMADTVRVTRLSPDAFLITSTARGPAAVRSLSAIVTVGPDSQPIPAGGRYWSLVQ